MRNELFKLVLVLTLLAACAPTLGGVPDKAAARSLCDRAMQKILADDISGAYDLLKMEMGVALPEMDTVVLQTIQQRSAVNHWNVVQHFQMRAKSFNHSRRRGFNARLTNQNFDSRVERRLRKTRNRKKNKII